MSKVVNLSLALQKSSVFIHLKEKNIVTTYYNIITSF